MAHVTALGGRTGEPRTAVVLAIHRPKPHLLRRQVATILGQEDMTLRVFAVAGAEDLGSEVAAILADPRIEIVSPGSSAGIRETFLHGLRYALEATAGDNGPWIFAFADQDDVWHPQKLKRSLAAMARPPRGLVHCDARVVTDDGTLIAPSLHRYEARLADATLFGNLLLNDVTGMTAVFSRGVGELTLRLAADLRSVMLHDHLAAIAAAATGPITWLDEALVDYVQHDANHLGAVRRQARPWWTRSFAPAAWRQYRATSAMLFADRRSAAASLVREGCAGAHIDEMFLCGTEPGVFRLTVLYWSAALRFLLNGQRRRAVLCLRFLDAALALKIAAPDRRA